MVSEIIFSSACHGWPCNVSTFLDTSLKGFSMPLDCLVIAFGYTCYLQEIPILKSSARIAAQLNYLCPQFFLTPACLSLHYHNNEMQPSPASSEFCSLLEKGFGTLRSLLSFLKKTGADQEINFFCYTGSCFKAFSKHIC